MGLGRENITAVLPLYLFKEHWEIARRRAPPLYGLMCTLDIMGYASNQQFTIPFKVLIKAIEQANQNPTEMNKLIVELLQQTCSEIIKLNNEFRKNVITNMSDFCSQPAKRTADVISSMEVFLA